MAGILNKFKEVFGSILSLDYEGTGKSTVYSERSLNNRELYDLLVRIDKGDNITEAEKQMLNHISRIDWSDTTITKLPNSLEMLTSLSELYLDFTEISDINVLSKLTSLSHLELRATEVRDISALSKLTSLSDLRLSDTKVSDISALSKLTSLSHLELRATEVRDISALSELKALETLDLGTLEINDLSALSRLTALNRLNLQNSKTAAIPESILDLNLRFITDESLFLESGINEGIYIHGLTLTDQPIEIFSQKKELIRAYYREGNQVPVNECKVIFLGDAESGKTHSIRRLLKNGEYLKDFDGASTPGIEISVSSIKLANTEIVVNYWDFGGQEIQHSMHRMFLTERTVYVVFLNARQDELMDERARYWLENIKAFAPRTPVLVVINKIDQNNLPRFNEKGFINSYGSQVKKVIRLSAKKDEKRAFLDKLQGNINSIIMELPSVSKKIPGSWKNLMESIRGMEEYYLTTEQFIERCESNKIKDYKNIHDELVDLFQVIGVSFCYYKDRSISDYMLLNPRWMLNALYIIVTNGKVVAQNGVIKQNNLYDLLEKDLVNRTLVRRVIPGLRYKSFEVYYILGVIRMFGLSYNLKDGSEFFPMLCDVDEKMSVKEAVPEAALHFIFRYKYLPSNVMHRLIVEMQRDLDYQYVWYTGAIFRNNLQNQTAYVHSIGNNLHIYVFGEDKYYNLNEYLTPISNVVRDINQGLGISAAEFLTYRSDSGEAEIPLKRVMGNLRNGIDKEYNETLDEIIYYDAVARRYFDNRPKADDILNTVVYALQIMQNDRTYYRTEENSRGLEDSRNRFVSAQLGAAGYLCGDQQTGGISLTGKAPGERDFVVKNKNGVDLLIYEALNLKTFDSSYINKHIQKLLNNYNPMGLHQGILVSYLECERNEFKSFTDKYRKQISEYAPQPYRCVGEPKDLPTPGQFMSCMVMNYETGGLYFVINHIIVRIAP